MSTRPLSSLLATLLIGVLLIPSTFLVAPQRAQALFGIGDIVHDPINWIENSLSAALDITSNAAIIAQKVNAYVLEPLAFVLSGEVLKLITAGVISFVIGEANGTGIPQFVVDVQESLRTVSDSQAYAFLKQYGENSNSPFSGSIRASLEEDYFSKTSLKGFWEQNMSTLRQSSSLYSDAYLYGDWSRGGLHSWFALTTRYENNPYMQHQRAQEQMARMIGRNDLGAVGARLEELQWGNGFMSWCGGAFGRDYELPEGQESSFPGDDCIDPETGQKLKIKTPGTVIADALDRALGYEGEKILRMGNVGPQINEILGNVATVMQTVNFATQILGGEGSGGLFGAGQSSSSQSDPRIARFNTPGFLGATQSGVYQGSSVSQVGADVLARATQYESAWNTIKTSAEATSGALADLKSSCSSYASEVDAALAGPVASVFAQAATASSTAASTRSIITSLQADIAASSSSTQENFLPRIQALQSLSPTQLELNSALQNAQALNAATSTPPGSLTVSNGSLVDQMNLIRTNAGIQKTLCTGGQSQTI